MEGYQPFKPNPNEIFGFTKPVESVVVAPTSTMQPNWGVICIGGLMLVVVIYVYQNRQINQRKKGL